MPFYGDNGGSGYLEAASLPLGGWEGALGSRGKTASPPASAPPCHLAVGGGLAARLGPQLPSLVDIEVGLCHWVLNHL